MRASRTSGSLRRRLRCNLLAFMLLLRKGVFCMVSEDDIKNALKAVKYPGYSRDIVSFGLVKEVAAGNGAISVSMQLTAYNPEAAKQIKSESEQILRSLPGVTAVHVDVKQQPGAQTGGAQSPWAQQNRVPGIRRVV